LQDKQDEIYPNSSEFGKAQNFNLTATLKHINTVDNPIFHGNTIHGSRIERSIYLSWKRKTLASILGLGALKPHYLALAKNLSMRQINQVECLPPISLVAVHIALTHRMGCYFKISI
jgi:hypothetical protein